MLTTWMKVRDSVCKVFGEVCPHRGVGWGHGSVCKVFGEVCPRRRVGWGHGSVCKVLVKSVLAEGLDGVMAVQALGLNGGWTWSKVQTLMVSLLVEV